ncbi:mitochondrial ribosomal death-associated protein 3-domain-containing protein [Lenzites betulinus]|nr:mitochondrial ribosomal death-associated protein 3-domain-containing protein [Lenzites betulinus]
MSLVAALRTGRAVHSTPVTLGSSAGVGVQTRGYAAPVKAAKKVSSKFRPNAGNDNNKKRGPRDAGVFRPMSVNNLSDPVFQSDQRTTLELPVFRPEAITHTAANKAMAFPQDESKALKAYGLPTNVLVDYMLLTKPCSVVREATISMLDQLDSAAGTSSKDTRVVLTGKSGCGKSYLLVQAVQYSIQKQWISLYIPRAINLVNSSSAFAYDARTQTYNQPFFAQQLLKRFVDVNEALIQSLTVQGSYPLEDRAVSIGAPLADLINLGVELQHMAPVVLSALLDELATQTKYPVLLAIDDFQALYCMSAYRDPFFRAVKAYHLTLPRTLLEFASGKKAFARGAVLGALSTQNTTYRTPLELVESLGLEPSISANPYVHREAELVEYAKGLKNFPVPEQLTVDEAASLFDLWQQKKALHLPHADEIFLAKYTESGGNAREFVQKGLLQTVTL